jgi:hypothetical protein
MTNTRIEADGITLADYTDTIITDDVDESPVFEVVERIDAEEVEVLDRGNVQTVFTFTVGRGHETLQEVQDYRLLFAATVPRFAALLTVRTRNFNESEIERYLVNVGIKVRRPRATGLYTFADFTIIGGQFQENKP